MIQYVESHWKDDWDWSGDMGRLGGHVGSCMYVCMCEYIGLCVKILPVCQAPRLCHCCWSFVHILSNKTCRSMAKLSK